ncbi:prepilin peptidase [Sulfoacidibacillus thermotolerans]|nr:A24 family peptidase [Sulfoacidibacillus thermotolerans]
MGIYGLVFGSFFGVVGMRVPKGESIVTPPSHCPACGRKLAAYELIPVISWLLLRGKCRTCHSSVSVLYPLVEIVTGVFFVLTWLHFRWTPEFLIALFTTSILVIVSVSDFLTFRLPNQIVLPSISLLFVLRLFFHPLGMGSYLMGAFIGFLLIYSIALISKGGMGFGDAKLFFLVGLYVGFAQTVFTLLLASVLGAGVGIVLRLIGKLQKRAAIPFGPYIASAAIFIHLYGSSFIAWYMGQFS